MRILIQAGLLVFMLCLGTFSQAQIAMDCDSNLVSLPPEKIELQRLYSHRTKKLDRFQSISIMLKAEDSLHQLNGSLLDVKSNYVLIEPTSEYWSYYSDEVDFNKTLYYWENCQAAVPIAEIEYLHYTSRAKNASLFLTFFSLASATIVAPLASIDKNAPNHFNTKRYTTILFSSLIGTGVGITFFITQSSSLKRFKLRPEVAP
jgi:hypothetical protein